ncbi:sensor histidine kinase [Streptomyces tsukubensis]|uniref:histidine kinase n=1 Tax=Streptomyces tsukubensis TaxID=83656 RepID=A0A1V4A1X3_9ACTN|nr:histidine kinase [Streptomyces tsukubensis]OON72508.1 hypothetical protein B1H18_29385 [Streptomyces tsukubensis]QFR93631.1 sensor histidine kinase [Streptomyces tsukubensis]
MCASKGERWRGGQWRGGFGRAVPASRRARLLDAALWLLLCAAPVTGAVSAGGPDTVTTAVGVPLLGVATWLGRRWPVAAAAVPLALSLALDPEMLTPLYWPALAVFGYLAGRRSAAGRPALWLLGAAAFAGLPLCALVARDLWGWPTQLLTLLFSTGLPWLLGRHRRTYAELTRAGWRLAERMEREQQAVADRTRARERARIAGDMHDSLGHDLTLLAVRAGVLEVDPGLDATRQAAVGELREAAAEATERLREIIGVLRAEGEDAPVTPAREDPSALVVRARASGVPVTLERDDSTDGLPPMVGPAVRRVVQESLTNAAKHAPGARVRVAVVRERSALRVRVVTDPASTGPLPGVASGGSGLVGLDERVRLAGGSLRAGRTVDGGFEVVAEFGASTTAGAGAGAEGAGAEVVSPPSVGPFALAEPSLGAGALFAPVGGSPGAGALSAPVGGSPGAEALPATTEGSPGAEALPATTEGSPGSAALSALELERARSRVRRGLTQTVVAPLAVLAGILVLMAPISLASSSLSVLDGDRYDVLRVGESREKAEAGLPVYTRDGPPDGAPRTPRGQECVYYGTRIASSDAYRLCFEDGRIASKARVGTGG